MHTESTKEAAKTLAIPTIRKLIRDRRNAVRHDKAMMIHTLNTSLRRALRAALMLGITPGDLHARLGELYDDIRAAVILEAQAVKLFEVEVMRLDRELLSLATKDLV